MLCGCSQSSEAVRARRQSVREREEENNKKRRVFFLILITTVNTVITYVLFTITGLVFALTQQLYQILWSVMFVLYWLDLYHMFFICIDLENSRASASVTFCAN